MSVESYVYGKMPDGREVTAYRLSNKNNVSAEIINLGGVITRLLVPDNKGVLTDVVLGYENCSSYWENEGSLGATIGRVANRIANAEYSLNGIDYKLAANNGPNNLHSNPDSFYKRLWESRIIDDSSVEMSVFSPDSDQGYPGNFKVSVVFSLTEDNSLKLTYTMTSDKDTLANMTNHSYFNLSGHNSGNILDQSVVINADYYTPSDKTLIPTGEIAPVKNTPFDFNEKKTIGRDINEQNEQLVNGGGYDHNYVLNNDMSFGFAASMESASTGIAMDVFTDMPGMQFYTANQTSLKGGKDNAEYAPYCAACFETQLFPDAIHHDNFPSCVLKAGEVITSVTEYHFRSI